MSLFLADLCIQPLSLTPEFIPQVAAWHHQECERQGLKSSLALRQQRLQLHLLGRAVPQTLIATCGENIFGCVSLVNYQSGARPQSAGLHSPVWLSNLYVQEPHRQQGIGTLLVDDAIEYAKNLALPELWLSATDFTDFYQKRGWKITRRTRLGGRVVNIMKKDIAG